MEAELEVEAEMVATVLRVQAEPGAQVRPGEQLLLLESMKMEIPVLAEVAGTLTKVLVAPGDVVQRGQALLVLRPRGTPPAV